MNLSVTKRLEGRSQKGAPSFAEVREDLARDVMNARIPGLKLAALREVDVKIRDIPTAPDAGQGHSKVAAARDPAAGHDR